MASRPLDETDRLLLEELWRDARQSHQSIASALGVSEGTVRSRLKRLEADGVVRVTTLRNVHEISDFAFAYLWINCDRRRLRDIAQTLAAEEHVGFVASILGRADLLAIVHETSQHALLRFVDEVVKPLRGVVDVRTEPMLAQLKIVTRWGLVRTRER